MAGFESVRGGSYAPADVFAIAPFIGEQLLDIVYHLTQLCARLGVQSIGRRELLVKAG